MLTFTSGSHYLYNSTECCRFTFFKMYKYGKKMRRSNIICVCFFFTSMILVFLITFIIEKQELQIVYKHCPDTREFITRTIEL